MRPEFFKEIPTATKPSRQILGIRLSKRAVRREIVQAFVFGTSGSGIIVKGRCKTEEVKIRNS